MEVERRRRGLSSALSYKDPKAAFRWLEDAFGFEPSFVILDEAGDLAHSEMSFGGAVIMVGSEWSENHRSPANTGGKNTQSVHIQLDPGEDVDAHCARARAAGAEIIQDPETQFYGDRTYRAKYPEGHIWTVGVTVEEVSPEAWDKAGGMTTRARLD